MSELGLSRLMDYLDFKLSSESDFKMNFRCGACPKQDSLGRNFNSLTIMLTSLLSNSGIIVHTLMQYSHKFYCILILVFIKNYM